MGEERCCTFFCVRVRDTQLVDRTGQVLKSIIMISKGWDESGEIHPQ